MGKNLVVVLPARIYGRIGIPGNERAMIQKTITRRSLTHYSSIPEDLAYWLSRPLEERLAAVDYLRQQYYGSSARLQRVVRVIQRPSG